jgi:AmpE protein
MTFIVTFIALLIERFFDWSHIRNGSWYLKLEAYVAKKVMPQSPYLILALTILPILLAIGLIGFLVKGVLYGLVTLVLQLFILLYCFGPKNLWADHFLTSQQNTQTDAVQSIFVEANRRIFSVIFWFAVLGPVGALLYRIVTISAQEGTLPPVARSAKQVEALLDWVPVRILTFIFALGGHFARVLSIWRQHFKLSLFDNETLLIQCGMAALAQDNPPSPDQSIEKNAIHLLDRVFVITLVILAILVLLI